MFLIFLSVFYVSQKYSLATKENKCPNIGKPVSLLVPTVVWLLNTSYAFDFCYSFQLVITTEYEEVLLNIFHNFQKMEESVTNDVNLEMLTHTSIVCYYIRV